MRTGTITASVRPGVSVRAAMAVELKQEVAGLRVATMDELDLIVPAHAQIAFDESGIDPLSSSRTGLSQAVCAPQSKWRRAGCCRKRKTAFQGRSRD